MLLNSSFKKTANLFRSFYVLLLRHQIGIISLLTLVISGIPLVCRWDIPVIINNETLVASHAFQSFEFFTSLVVSLSLSIPVIVEILIRCVMISDFSELKQAVAPNANLLFCIMVPDLVILFYVIPYQDLEIMQYIIHARIILIDWVCFSFLETNGGHVWTRVGTLIIVLSECISRATNVYICYFTGSITSFLSFISVISDNVSTIFFMIYIIKWIIYVINERKRKSLSKEDSLCNIYALALLVCCIGVGINYYIHDNSLTVFDWDPTNLTVHTLCFTVFYILVIVFEGRVAQRDMMKTKVNHTTYSI